MKIKQQYLKLIIIITILCSSYAMYLTYVNTLKHKYKAQVKTNIQLLLAQQQGLLRQLSKNILDPIKHQNISIISVSIRSYENILFSGEMSLKRVGDMLPANFEYE